MVPNLQLDPPDAQLLYWKGCSVCFLNEHAWALSGSQQGRFLHMLTDLMSQVSGCSNCSEIMPGVYQCSYPGPRLLPSGTIDVDSRQLRNRFPSVCLLSLCSVFPGLFRFGPGWYPDMEHFTG